MLDLFAADMKALLDKADASPSPALTPREIAIEAFMQESRRELVCEASPFRNESAKPGRVSLRYRPRRH